MRSVNGIVLSFHQSLMKDSTLSRVLCKWRALKTVFYRSHERLSLQVAHLPIKFVKNETCRMYLFQFVLAGFRVKMWGGADLKGCMNRRDLSYVSFCIVSDPFVMLYMAVSAGQSS